MSVTHGNSLFLHIKDFYNFIKKEGGDNSPTTVYYFSVNFYPNSYQPPIGDAQIQFRDEAKNRYRAARLASLRGKNGADAMVDAEINGLRSKC